MTLRSLSLEDSIRRDAFTVFRKNLLPILLVLVLLALPTWIGTAIQVPGNAAIRAASQLPDNTTELNLRFTDTEAYFSYLEGVAAAEKAAQPAADMAMLLELLPLFYSPLLMLGLYRGLQNHMRGGTFRLRDLVACRRLYGRALWLDVLIFLITLAIALGASALTALLSSFLHGFGTIIALIVTIPVMLYVMIRFSFAHAHMADANGGDCLSASDCLRASSGDVKEFTILSILATVWPILVGTIVLEVIGGLSLTGTAAVIVTVLAEAASLLLSGWSCCCYAGIYEFLRRGEKPRDPHKPLTPGEERARALASQEP